MTGVIFETKAKWPYKTGVIFETKTPYKTGVIFEIKKKMALQDR